MKLPLRYHSTMATGSGIEAFADMLGRYPNVRGFTPIASEKKFVFEANWIGIGSVLLTAGSSSGFSFSETAEDRLTLAIPLAGRAEVVAGGKTMQLSANGVLASGLSDIRATYHPGFAALFLTVGLDELETYASAATGQKLELPGEATVFWGLLAHRFRTVVMEAVNTIDAFEGDAARCMPILRLDEHLMRMAVAALSCGHSSNEEDAPDLSDQQIRRARAFIEENAARGIGVSDVARAAGVSVRTLQVAFSRRLHCSPYSYIQEQRLRLAYQALLNAKPDQTVREIARSFGFGHFGRFSMMIRRLSGKSPSEILRREG